MRGDEDEGCSEHEAKEWWYAGDVEDHPALREAGSGLRENKRSWIHSRSRLSSVRCAFL